MNRFEKLLVGLVYVFVVGLAVVWLSGCGFPADYTTDMGISVHATETGMLTGATDIDSRLNRVWRKMFGSSMYERYVNGELDTIEVRMHDGPIALNGIPVGGICWPGGGIEVWIGNKVVMPALEHEMGHYVSEYLNGHGDGQHKNRELWMAVAEAREEYKPGGDQ